MKKRHLFALIALTGLSVCSQEVVSTTNAPVELSAAGKLYRQAVSERESGEPKQAIQTAAKIVAMSSDAGQWMSKTELLCAELYVELDMLDAADVTARQIVLLYEGTEAAEKASALRKDIEKLMAEKELELSKNL